jgi:2-polyprenyl-6-methoxyphenol hydroxylase-like FAD-dependent oxidoreductase
MDTRVLISGASIAGPSLAYWLARRGAHVTVVERAPALRGGGHGVDFRGAQMELLRRMDLLDAVRARETGMGEQRIVDADGRVLVRMPSAFFSGEVEIGRGDLAQLLYDRTSDDVEYVFGDHVTALHQDADGVDVTFAGGGARRFDLVVGADGLHSGVRAAAFGPEEGFRTFLGHYHAGFTMPNELGLDHVGLMYNEPGRGVMVSSGRDPAVAGVGFVFSSEELVYDRHDRAALVDILRRRYAGAGWEVPRLLRALDQTSDLYFDSLAQIHVDRWSRGRVALVGDAAWAAGPGGSGTGLAMMGAYVLAADLDAAGPGGHALAFARYEAAVRKAATVGYRQGKGSGGFLAPPTQKAIRRRDRAYRMLSSRLLLPVFNRITAGAANALTLDAYPAELARSSSASSRAARRAPSVSTGR